MSPPAMKMYYFLLLGNGYFYHIVAKIPNIQHEISCDVVGLHTQ